jgi:transcriptional regulator with XRE-family HTH domain
MFTANLKRLRQAAGLTQVELARKLRMSLRTLQGWEQGYREPELSNINRIAKALGVDVGELVAEEPVKGKPKKR